MNKLYQKYPGSAVFELKLIDKDIGTKKLNKVYGHDEASFILNQFQKGATFYMDAGLLTNQKNHFIMRIHTINLNKNEDQVKLWLILDEDVFPIKNTRKTPLPYDPSRTHSSMIYTPFYFEATFKVIEGMPYNDDGIYGNDTIHHYYNEQQQLQEGGKKVTKQYLIDLCRKRKIPYSGRTKAELIVALRK
jgi:hypothetical protein